MAKVTWIVIVSVILKVANVEAGTLGVLGGGAFLTGSRNCARGSNAANYTGSSYSCYAIALTETTWEFARDRCRDDGGTLAIFTSADEYKTIQINMTGFLNMTNSTFNWIGVNQDGRWNNTIAPESVPYGVTALYGRNESLLADSDANRDYYRCGVMPKPNWTMAGLFPSNAAAMRDPQTGQIWPYAPSPYMFKCAKDGYDTYLQSYVCRLPGGPDNRTCICGKWKEPVVRNFKGDSFTLQDQTEYIMVQTSTYNISILLWSGKSPSFPNLTNYFPDKGAPVQAVRIEFGGTLYEMATGQASPCIAIYSVMVNGTCTYRIGQNRTTINGLTVGTISSNASWMALYILMPDGTRVMYDQGNNVEIMTVNSTGNSLNRGLCGTCNANVTWGNPLPDGRLTTRKLLLSTSWIHPRTLFARQPPAIETCGCKVHRRYAADRCRPLINTIDANFGRCLANNATARDYAYKNYRACVTRVCSHGPAAACVYFKNLSNICVPAGYSYNTILAQCSDTALCPLNRPYYQPSPNGICYHVGLTEMYWDQAYRYCHSIGAQLVSFTNQDDNDFIQCKIAPALLANITDPTKQFLWLGGVRDNQNQRHWTDGLSTSYSNWITDNTEVPTARCATFDIAKGRWIMKSCESSTFRPFCYVYSTTNSTCSDLPCMPPKVCIDGSCVRAATPVNPCDPNPCLNGGQCFTQGYYGSGYMCVCESGDAGTVCSRGIRGTRTKPFPSLDPSQVNKNFVYTARRPAPSTCWLNGSNADYLVVTDTPLAWELAREKCRSYGGRLNEVDLTEEKTFFPSTPAWSAYYRATGTNVFYMKDGKQNRRADNTAVQFPTPGCLSWDGSGGCLPDDGNPKCSLATSSGAEPSVTCPVTAADTKPYVCKRASDRCFCSKSFEPVVRTFNGEDVPVNDDAAYILFSSPNITISIAMHDPGFLIDKFSYGKFLAGSAYFPDQWPVVSRVSVILQPSDSNTSSTCELRITLLEMGLNADFKSGTNFSIEQDCDPLPSGVTISKISNDQPVNPLVPHTYKFDALASYGVTFVYDGANVELAVNWSVAASVKPGNGLCGACDDMLRDTLFSQTHQITENKRVVAANLVVAVDAWPDYARRIPTCTTDARLRAAERLCYRLFKYYPIDTPEPVVNELHRKCLKNVCLYGPSGVCSLTQFSSQLSVCTGSCTGSMKYANSLVDRQCQFTDLLYLEQKNFYDTDFTCQSRAFNLADNNPNIVTVDDTHTYWVGAVTDMFYLIKFWLRGVDVTNSDYTPNYVALTLNAYPCVSFKNNTWKNDLASSQSAVGVCTANSGRCGASTCLPPNICEPTSGTCSPPPTTITWPVY